MIQAWLNVMCQMLPRLQAAVVVCANNQPGEGDYRLLGATVERGELLFEFAPLDDYRLVLDVPENRITTLEPGQTGYLVLNAFPDRRTWRTA